MAEASGFTWQTRRNGEVRIEHRGRLAATLRGSVAADFLEIVRSGDTDAAQQEAARLTGNYKRGNERLAKGHPRNG